MPEARTTRTVHRRLRRQHRLRKTFCREPFREDGVEYKLSEKPKSDLDAETLKNVLDTAIKREVLVRDCEAQGVAERANPTIDGGLVAGLLVEANGLLRTPNSAAIWTLQMEVPDEESDESSGEGSTE